jgi:hypothetical protein
MVDSTLLMLLAQPPQVMPSIFSFSSLMLLPLRLFPAAQQ